MIHHHLENFRISYRYQTPNCFFSSTWGFNSTFCKQGLGANPNLEGREDFGKILLRPFTLLFLTFAFTSGKAWTVLGRCLKYIPLLCDFREHWEEKQGGWGMTVPQKDRPELIIGHAAWVPLRDGCLLWWERPPVALSFWGFDFGGG